MSALIKPLIHYFQAHADPEQARGMSAYLRHQFQFFGIKAPQRVLLSRAYLNTHGQPSELIEQLKLARACYQAPYRELQYFVQDWLKPQAKRLGPEHLPLIEELIQTQPWWDTVDFLAPTLVGAILSKDRALWEDYPERWIHHESLWLRRSAIIFQLKYKERTEDEVLLRYCLSQAQEREFFIQKAMGWALRERSKTRPQLIRDFVSAHELPALTRREALKWLKSKER